jgi:hypothetical protein
MPLISIFPFLLSGFGIERSNWDSTVRPADGGEFRGVNGGLHGAREWLETKYFRVVRAFIVWISGFLERNVLISESRVVRVPTVGRFEEDIISYLWLYEYHDTC